MNINPSISKEVEDSVLLKIPEVGEWLIIYGHNRYGYFIQFHPKDEIAQEELERLTLSEYEEYLELDTNFNGLTGVRLGILLEKIGCTDYLNIICSVLDLPF